MNLAISSPCHEAWDAMTPNTAGRHCAVCDKTVLDLTAMPADQAKAYLARELPSRLHAGERICVRAHTDRHLRLLRPGQRLLTNAFAGMLAMTMAGALGFGPALHGADTPAPITQDPVPMGELVAPQPIKQGRIVCDVPEPIQGDVVMGKLAIDADTITAISRHDVPLTLTPQVIEQVKAIVAEAEGRWQNPMAIPMIAPTYTIHRADGQQYQIVMTSILTGPNGGLRDEALVGRLLAVLGACTTP